MEIKNTSIESFYGSINEDIRLKQQNANKIEFLTTVKYLEDIIEPHSKILDACAGSGIYSFYFAEKGHFVYTGDLLESHVKDIRRTQKNGSQLQEIFVGSILNLSQYDDNSFDVVLNLGSYYHLLDENKRYQSLRESIRVLKNGGIYALAYINKYANIIKYREMFVEEFKLLDEYLEKGYHYKNEIFFVTTPEAVENEVNKHELLIENNIATDGMKFIVRDTVNKLSVDEFSKWLDFHFQTCEDKSILGASEHGLIIARKK